MIRGLEPVTPTYHLKKAFEFQYAVQGKQVMSHGPLQRTAVLWISEESR
jgi:hypothetical protein